MIPIGRQSSYLRIGAFAASGLFLFFLLYLTPHRVHHFFDRTGDNSCVAYAVGKGCHLQESAAIDLPYVYAAVDQPAAPGESRVPRVTASPYSPRAPPAA